MALVAVRMRTFSRMFDKKGDGVEDAAHSALLLVPRDALVPEVGIGSLVGVVHRAASISVAEKALAFRGRIGYKAQLFERGSCTRPVS